MEEIIRKIESFLPENKVVFLEEKVYLWEELLYLFKSKNHFESSLLVSEIIDVLEIMTAEVNSRLERFLKRKLFIFSRYSNKSKDSLRGSLNLLISNPQRHFNEKNKILIFNDAYFCSHEIADGAEETYHLIEKLEEKNEHIKHILFLLKKSKLILSESESLDLKENLVALCSK